jgi:hypothetical protein
MSDMPPHAPLPRDLRFLKLLVATLTGVMILGLLTLVGLIALRLPAPSAPLPVLPQGLTLPDGATPAALTFTARRLIVVTQDGAVLVFDRDSGDLLESLPLP